jgi:hypothetical protein
MAFGALGGAVRTSISDKAFLEIMERKGRHKVLDEGTPLLMCLTIKPEKPRF